MFRTLYCQVPQYCRMCNSHRVRCVPVTQCKVSRCSTHLHCQVPLYCRMCNSHRVRCVTLTQCQASRCSTHQTITSAFRLTKIDAHLFARTPFGHPTPLGSLRRSHVKGDPYPQPGDAPGGMWVAKTRMYRYAANGTYSLL